MRPHVNSKGPSRLCTPSSDATTITRNKEMRNCVALSKVSAGAFALIHNTVSSLRSNSKASQRENRKSREREIRRTSERPRSRTTVSSTIPTTAAVTFQYTYTTTTLLLIFIMAVLIVGCGAGGGGGCSGVIRLAEGAIHDPNIDFTNQTNVFRNKEMVLCFMIWGQVEDKGYSEMTQQGMRLAVRALEAKYNGLGPYPKVSFRTEISSRNSDYIGDNVTMRARLNAMVSLGCDYLFVSFYDFAPVAWLKQIAFEKPNMMVMLGSVSGYESDMPRNMITAEPLCDREWYLAGIIAGGVGRNCVGLVAPFSTVTMYYPHAFAKGIERGAKSVESAPSIELHVAVVNDWRKPARDVVAARLLMSPRVEGAGGSGLGCNVVAGYTNSAAATEEGVASGFAIGWEFNRLDSYGNKVLASVVRTFDDEIFSTIEFWMHNQTQGQRQYFRCEVSPLSPLVPTNVSQLFNAALADFNATRDIWGDNLYDQSGALRVVGPITDGTKLLSLDFITNLSNSSGPISSREDCKAGSALTQIVNTFSSNNKIISTCVPCPPRTFSLDNAIMCTPCPKGKTSGLGAYECDDEFWTPALIAAVTLAVAGGSALFIGLLTVLFCAIRRAKDQKRRRTVKDSGSNSGSGHLFAGNSNSNNKDRHESGSGDHNSPAVRSLSNKSGTDAPSRRRDTTNNRMRNESMLIIDDAHHINNDDRPPLTADDLGHDQLAYRGAAAAGDTFVASRAHLLPPNPNSSSFPLHSQTLFYENSPTQHRVHTNGASQQSARQGLGTEVFRDDSSDNGYRSSDTPIDPNGAGGGPRQGGRHSHSHSQSQSQSNRLVALDLPTMKTPRHSHNAGGGNSTTMTISGGGGGLHFGLTSGTAAGPHNISSSNNNNNQHPAAGSGQYNNSVTNATLLLPSSSPAAEGPSNSLSNINSSSLHGGLAINRRFQQAAEAAEEAMREEKAMRVALIESGSFYVGAQISSALGAHQLCKVVLANGTTVAMREAFKSTEADGREHELITRLPPHPGVIDYYAVKYVPETGATRVFMEYVSAQSLRQIVAEVDRPMADVTGRAFARQILTALAFLHQHNVAHRNLLNEHILVDAKGKVKIADLMTAKEVEKGSDQSLTIVSAPQNQPPEVLTCRHLLSDAFEQATKGDVWCFGVSCVEVQNKNRGPWPAEAVNTAGILKFLYTDQPVVIPSHISPTAADFMRKCLDRNPSTRWSAEALLKHPWIVDEGSSSTATANKGGAMASPRGNDSQLRFTLDHVIGSGAFGTVYTAFLRSPSDEDKVDGEENERRGGEEGDLGVGMTPLGSNPRELLHRASTGGGGSSVTLRSTFPSGRRPSPHHHQEEEKPNARYNRKGRGPVIAVKAIGYNSRDMAEANKLKKAMKEISVMQSLDHPNIVKYLFLEQSEPAPSGHQTVYIAMEHVAGGTLKQYMLGYWANTKNSNMNSQANSMMVGCSPSLQKEAEVGSVVGGESVSVRVGAEDKPSPALINPAEEPSPIPPRPPTCKGLPEREAAYFTQEILRGLSYLHGKGFTHRDIKPSNCLLTSSRSPFSCKGTEERMYSPAESPLIVVNGGSYNLCDEDGSGSGAATTRNIRNHTYSRRKGELEGEEGPTRLKLADFGTAFSSAVGAETVSVGMQGTLLYMSPEVMREEKPTSSADIWSLGASVMEMVTGDAPWAHLVSGSSFALISLIAGTDALTMPPLGPSALSAECVDFMRLCLNRDPHQRPTADALMLHPWLKVIDDADKSLTKRGGQGHRVEEESTVEAIINQNNNGANRDAAPKMPSLSTSQNGEGGGQQSSRDKTMGLFLPGMLATSRSRANSSDETGAICENDHNNDNNVNDRLAAATRTCVREEAEESEGPLLSTLAKVIPTYASPATVRASSPLLEDQNVARSNLNNNILSNNPQQSTCKSLGANSLFIESECGNSEDASRSRQGITKSESLVEYK